MGQHDRRPDREVTPMAIDPVKINNHTTARRLFADMAANGTLENIPLFFEANVLDPYQNKTDFKIIRTDTSGRIAKSGGWRLDFGISGENDSIIQITANAFLHQLPASERDHWLDHMITLPVSENFLKGLMRPGCLDDGEIRKWP